MKLLIIRHATPDYKNKTIKPIGHKEAEALGQKMGKIGLTKIYASPMGRAQHTMQYTSDETGLPCETQEWMQELVHWKLPDGSWPWKIHTDEVFDQQNFYDYKNWYQSPRYEGGDLEAKFGTLMQNSDDFLKALGYERTGSKYKCLVPNDEVIAIFCHAGFGAAWISHILGIPFSMVAMGLPMSPSAVSYIEFKGEEGEEIYPKCLRFGDTSHLDHSSMSYID